MEVYKTNRNSFRTGMLIALVLFIGFSTVAAYVFWSSGVTGATVDANRDVQIGAGGSVITEINLTDSDTGGTLIPTSVALRPETDEVHAVSFTFNVNWDANLDATQAGGGAASDLIGVVGNLDVNVNSISIGGIDYLTVAGRHWNGTAFEARDYLFMIDVDAPNTIIGGGESVPVTITVSMNQPLDEATYLEIHNQAATLAIEFNVTTE